jgi:TPR repeat protein
MKIFRENRSNKEKLKEAFQMLKEVADETQDPEACWRVGACYCRGIGVEKNLQISLEYAKISMDKGSIDGVFWYGRILSDIHSGAKVLSYFQQAAKADHLAAIFGEGNCIAYGYGIKANKEIGKQKSLTALTSGDGYWTLVYSRLLDKGILFNKNLEESIKLQIIWKSQSICDCSLFEPTNFDIPW